MTGLEILTIALGLAMGGALILWRIQADYCSHCVHCRHELAEKKRRADEARAKEDAARHLRFHEAYGTEGCPTCKESE